MDGNTGILNGELSILQNLKFKLLQLREYDSNNVYNFYNNPVN